MAITLLSLISLWNSDACAQANHSSLAPPSHVKEVLEQTAHQEAAQQRGDKASALYLGHAKLAEAAKVIQDAYFHFYFEEFKPVTQRAKTSFENRDWKSIQKDTAERLALYSAAVNRATEAIRPILGDSIKNRKAWKAIKDEFSRLIATRYEADLAKTFFNRVARRLFVHEGIDFEYIDDGTEIYSEQKEYPPVYKGYPGHKDISFENPRTGEIEIREEKKTTEGILEEIFKDYPFHCGYQNLNRDIKIVAQDIDAYLKSQHLEIENLQIAIPLFFRNKGAYIVGRIKDGPFTVPLVIPLLNSRTGVFVHTTLFDKVDAAAVFSSTRANFFVDIERYRGLVEFLQPITGQTELAWLYKAIGYKGFGKTKQYEDLLAHVRKGREKFEVAEGVPGRNLSVITTPSEEHPYVYKIIRDSDIIGGGVRRAFEDYKLPYTRDGIMEKYRLVDRMDRVGRLLEPMTFESLRFKTSQFSGDVLCDMLATCKESVESDISLIRFKKELFLLSLLKIIESGPERHLGGYNDFFTMDTANITFSEGFFKERLGANLPAEFLQRAEVSERHDGRYFSFKISDFGPKELEVLLQGYFRGKVTMDGDFIALKKEAFTKQIQEALREECLKTASVDGTFVLIKHCYAQRKVTPLNVWLTQLHSDEEIRRVLVDFGNCLKELAGANIFVADLFLKNFGVTTYGRVVCYDYDDLELMVNLEKPSDQLNFRHLPPGFWNDINYTAEHVSTGQYDVFPEQLEIFLGIPQKYKAFFKRVHGDLYTPGYWTDIQARLMRDEVIDFFPYPISKAYIERFPDLYREEAPTPAPHVETVEAGALQETAA